MIEDAGQKGILIPGDLRDEQFNYDMVETAYNELGGLDNVTLVAGHQQYHDDIHGFNTEAFADVLKRMYIQYSGQFKSVRIFKTWLINYDDVFRSRI